MPYLLDTNHCIYLMNGWNREEEHRTPEEQQTIVHFQGLDDEDIVCMSEASVGELLYGIERSERKASNRMRFHVFVSAIPPVPVVREVWDIYGETKAELSLCGKRIPDMDLLIASTAKYYDLVLVAHDKHMQYLPNKFRQENWAKRVVEHEK